MKRNWVISIIGLTLSLMANSGGSAQTQAANTLAAQFAPAVVTEEIIPDVGSPSRQLSSGHTPPGLREKSLISSKGYIDIKVYALRQFRRSNPAAFIEGSAARLVRVMDFRPRSSIAPKIEVGYDASRKFGARASYFYIAQELDGDQVAPQSPEFVGSIRPLNLFGVGSTAGGKTMQLRQRLRMNVVDLEVEYKAEGKKYSALFSAGGRLANTFQRFSGMDAPGSSFMTIISYDQRRTGVGPTTAVDLRGRLGHTNSWLFGQGRFALLFGGTTETAQQRTTLRCCQTAERTTRVTTPVFEGEVGFTYARSMGGTRELLFSGSYVVQEWRNLVIVTPTPAVGTIAPGLAPLDDPGQPPKIRGNISFFGGDFKVGIRF